MEVFDRHSVLDRLMGDEELLKEVVDLYLEETPPQIAELNRALDVGDAALVARMGHALKGNAASLAAEVLQAAAQQMEMAGKAEDLNLARSLAPGLGREFDRLRTVLTSL